MKYLRKLTSALKGITSEVMIEMLSMTFILAVFSYMASTSVDAAYKVGGWQYYSTLALVDLSFMFIFGSVNIHRLKKRYISTILFIAVCSSLLLMLLSYVYVGYKEYHSLRSIIALVPQYYDMLSAILSVLIFVVAVTPKRILGIFDDRLWPTSLDFVYNCDIARRTNAVKKSASRCG